MNGVISPTHCQAGCFVPNAKPKPTRPTNSPPKPIEIACPLLARVEIGLPGDRKSIMERMRRLNMQLPSTSPSAMSGSPNLALAPRPVNNSGKDVVAATRIVPIHVRPIPVFSARTSPSRARKRPAVTITALSARNTNQGIS
jgi:hypothetical protein